MKNFKQTELIKCFRERKQDRCAECRLTGAAHHLPNGVEANIEALVDQVLDPAREAYGKPIYVNSGFRCPLHNKTVGGVTNSQHIAGEASDIHVDTPAENLRLAKIIAEQGKFDIMIIHPTFIHVSYKRNGDNRHRILTRNHK